MQLGHADRRHYLVRRRLFLEASEFAQTLMTLTCCSHPSFHLAVSLAAFLGQTCGEALPCDAWKFIKLWGLKRSRV